MPGSQTTSAQASKVAAVTLSFWILKTVMTTAGDLSGDVLSITLGMGYVITLIVVLAVIGTLLVAQVRGKGFHPSLYWALILVSSTAGTEISDTLERSLHGGSAGGAAVLFACLVASLAIWYVRRGEIAVYPVNAGEDELFYWIAAILANGLGSVLGDLLGDRLGFGVLGGMAVNVGVLTLLAMLHHNTRASRGFLFWAAFVFTRLSL